MPGLDLERREPPRRADARQPVGDGAHGAHNGEAPAFARASGTILDRALTRPSRDVTRRVISSYAPPCLELLPREGTSALLREQTAWVFLVLEPYLECRRSLRLLGFYEDENMLVRKRPSRSFRSEQIRPERPKRLNEFVSGREVADDTPRKQPAFRTQA